MKLCPGTVSVWLVPLSALLLSCQPGGDFQEAEALYSGGRYQEAIEQYNAAYQGDPGSPYSETSLMMIGICYGELGDGAAKVQYLERALKEFPDMCGFSESTYYYLGESYAAEERYQEALEMFRKSVENCECYRSPSDFPCKQARWWIEDLEKAGY